MKRPRTGRIVEIAFHLVTWLGWIVLLDAGHENGIGYFQQTEVDLLAPLVHGALFNAVLFFGNAYGLMPRLLARGAVRRYLAGLAGLTLAVLAGKTLGERVLILLWMPALERVSLGELARENVYVAIAMVVLSVLFRFACDGLRRLSRASRPAEPSVAPSATTALGPSSPPAEAQLFIKSGGTLHRIAVSSVLYVEAAGNYVAFVQKERRILSLMNMEQAQSVLPGDRFVRIHRSYIVGLDHLQRVERRRVSVAGAWLPIGATFRSQFKEALASLAGDLNPSASLTTGRGHHRATPPRSRSTPSANART
jgi:LytTr DNA-binding domain